MSNRLEKELQKLSQKEDSKSEKTETQAQLLLAAPKEDLNILTRLNIDHQIHKNRDIVAKKDKINHFKELFKSQVYTGKQIHEMCELYDLKCLPASSYKGLYDEELAPKLREFEENNKDILLNSSNLFIIAASEAFTDDTSNLNCIILYRDKSNGKYIEDCHSEDIFTVIHSWGKDFDPIRKYRFLLKSPFVLIWSFVLITLSFVGSSMILSTICITLVAIIFFINCLTETNTSWNHLDTN